MTVSNVGSSQNLDYWRQIQQSAFQGADTNGDGSLSQSEFDRMLKQGKDASDPTTIAGLMAGGSNSAAGMMQKLLAQLDAAMTTTTASSTTTGASSATGVNTTA